MHPSLINISVGRSDHIALSLFPIKQLLNVNANKNVSASGALKCISEGDLNWRIIMAFQSPYPLSPISLSLSLSRARRGIEISGDGAAYRRISIASTTSYMARGWLLVALDGHGQLGIVFESH